MDNFRLADGVEMPLRVLCADPAADITVFDPVHFRPPATNGSQFLDRETTISTVKFFDFSIIGHIAGMFAAGCPGIIPQAADQGRLAGADDRRPARSSGV